MKKNFLFAIVFLLVGPSFQEVDQPKDGKYPYHVAIRRKGWTTATCSGAIVGEHWIVTAASCFFRTNTPDIVQHTKEEDVEVVVGGIANLVTAVKELTFQVSEIILHPRFNPRSFNVLLIKVEKNLLEHAGAIKPQAVTLLSDKQEDEFRGKDLEATQYGHNGGDDTKLNHKKVRIGNNDSDCSGLEPFVKGHMYCHVFSGNCLSRTGSPLVYKKRESFMSNSKSYTLVGIGASCYGNDMYTRVPKVSEWIEGIIGKGN